MKKYEEIRNAQKDIEALPSYLSMKNGSVLSCIQLAIVISGMLFNGVIYGYTSTALPSFRRKQPENCSYFDSMFPNDLSLTSKEESLLTSLTQLGYPLGGLMSSLLVSLLGKRLASLFGQALSFILGQGLIFLAWNVEMLLTGRFICGLCQGFCNCLTYVYVIDLCRSNVRKKAICGVLLSLMGNSGTLLTYTIGIFVNWRQLAFILITFAAPYILGLIIFLPNDFPTEGKLLLSGKKKLGLTSTSTTTMPDASVENKIHQVVSVYNEKSNRVKNEFLEGEKGKNASMCHGSLLKCKPLYFGIGMMFFYQFAGYNVVSAYAGIILNQGQKSESPPSNFPNPEPFFATLDPALISAAFVGLAGLFGVIIGVFFVHRGFNRKIILYSSAFGTAMAFFALGLYFLMKPTNVNDIPWISTFCLVSHILLFNLGYGCLGYPMMAEMLPSKIRTKGMAFLTVIAGLFGFANQMSFVEMQNLIEIQHIFFSYAVINLLGLLYLFVSLPQMGESTK